MSDTTTSATATTQNAEEKPVTSATTAIGGDTTETTKADESTTTTAETATAAKPETVPEKYDLKLPEGAVITDADLAQVSTLAKELGITKSEAAQKLVDHQNAVLTNYQQAIIENHRKTVQKWGEDLKADPEFGGQNFEANVGHAKAALARFDKTGNVRKILNESGRGNDPDVAKMFAEIGKSMAEDKLTKGGQTTTAKPLAERMYGKT